MKNHVFIKRLKTKQGKYVWYSAVKLNGVDYIYSCDNTYQRARQWIDGAIRYLTELERGTICAERTLNEYLKQKDYI